MSDASQGPGWWQASDDKWYPPEDVPGPDPLTGEAWSPSAETTGGSAPPSAGTPPSPGWDAAPSPGPGWSPPATGAPSYGAPSYGAPSYGSPTYGSPGSGYAPVGGFAPYGGGYAAQPSVQGMATASLVLGIIALFLFWCWFIAWIPALVGLPLGAIALSKINKGTVSPQGKGVALAGVICSSLALVLAIGLLVLVAAGG